MTSTPTGRSPATEDAAGDAGATGTSRREMVDDDDAVPFHEGPVVLNKFPQPASREHKDIIQHCFEGLQKDGFVVLDDVLADEECRKLEEEIKFLESSGRMKTGKLAGGQTSGMKEEMVVNQNIRSDKIVWLEDTESDLPQISSLITNQMDGTILPFTALFNGEVSISGRTKAMVACYPGEGTNYHRHVDNPGGDGRIVTCLFYVNRDWDAEKMGGVLRIFPSSMHGKYVDIAPVLNRMILFWSDRRTPHEVHPAFQHRYAITMWYFNAEQRAKAKEQQMQDDIEKIQSDIAVMKVKTKKVEKETMEKKIEAKATSAINLLEPEELDALTHLVDACPDPRALLTSIGIAPIIQDKVLEAIAERKRFLSS